MAEGKPRRRLVAEGKPDGSLIAGSEPGKIPWQKRATEKVYGRRKAGERNLWLI